MSVAISISAILLATAPVAPETGPPPLVETVSPLSDIQTTPTPVPDGNTPVSQPVTPPSPPATDSPPPPIAPALNHTPPAPAGDDIVVRARARSAPGDPLQDVNAKSYAITQAVDDAIIRPVAKTYQRILPDPVRSGIRNFINNLREPVAFLNFMLQLKPGKAIETVGRFGINTTIGAAGLFDIAKRKPFKLPRRPNGFSNTLGYYGVKSGPFLFLPLIGPTTVRDLLGDNLDRLILPVAVGKPFNKWYVGIPIGIFSSLDQRAEYDETLQAIREKSDPYVERREEYLRRRQAGIDALHSQKWRDAHPYVSKSSPPPAN
jgi:phospholipid-binding lipoprotein MlaA